MASVQDIKTKVIAEAFSLYPLLTMLCSKFDMADRELRHYDFHVSRYGACIS